MVLALLLSCDLPPDPHLEGKDNVERYLTAWCRVYEADSRCAANAQRTCGWTRTLGDSETCRGWMEFEFSQCDGMHAWFQDEAHTPVIDACVADLQAFDCQNDDFCDRNGDITFESGACGDITAQVQATCPTALD